MRFERERGNDIYIDNIDLLGLCYILSINKYINNIYIYIHIIYNINIISNRLPSFSIWRRTVSLYIPHRYIIYDIIIKITHILSILSYSQILLISIHRKTPFFPLCWLLFSSPPNAIHPVEQQSLHAKLSDK